MDESSAFIWRTALHQVEGLPDCPADLTEQEYVDLEFDAHCHVRADSLRVRHALRYDKGLWKVGENSALVHTPQILSRLQTRTVRFRFHGYPSTGFDFTDTTSLVELSSCDDIICENDVLNTEELKIDKSLWNCGSRDRTTKSHVQN